MVVFGEGGYICLTPLPSSFSTSLYPGVIYFIYLVVFELEREGGEVRVGVGEYARFASDTALSSPLPFSSLYISTMFSVGVVRIRH